ncbi:hypothetical protein [Novosphingobium album (ex Hu et al. 2023)]|uniref:Uncharacterized protein n=1 Tax=Novosphingobium album (ex Hu et al. 2023) TaxID=2930093 RepID=A0ABT0B036_9SPHN|nr:hypothetical protein [Novosphingobium album (ex Hu et al. 2023)]MCJ2178414.1 hypothetical protein [Novosphingobium album (ex Hu et al. 2023)]
MLKEDVPACLVRAREEVLIALSAGTIEEAREHRQVADSYIKRAVLDLHQHPHRQHNWAALAAH